jgi:hypothetical protein
MTAQFSDVVLYEKRRYALAGISGSGLFDPSEHDIRVRMISTACWRGYLCEYTVEDNQLFLTALQLGAAQPPEEVFGAHVQPGATAVYRPIRVRQPFTGGLLLGAGFIEELYVHMGFHPAWKYKTVLELTFDDGRLDAAHDRSEPMAQRRAAQGSLKPTDLRDVEAWIDITFDHTYLPIW